MLVGAGAGADEDVVDHARIAVTGVGVDGDALEEALDVELGVELRAVDAAAHPDHLHGAVGRAGQQRRVRRDVDGALVVADEGGEGLGHALQQRVLAALRGQEHLGGAQRLGEAGRRRRAEVPGEHLQAETGGEQRHALLEGDGQELAHLLLHVQLRAGLGGLGGRQVVGAAAYEDAGDVAGREGVEEVDLLEPDVLELVALQAALKEEGLVLLLRRLDLRARGYHDKGFHGAHLIGRVRDLPGPVARAAGMRAPAREMVIRAGAIARAAGCRGPRGPADPRASSGQQRLRWVERADRVGRTRGPHPGRGMRHQIHSQAMVAAPPTTTPNQACVSPAS